MIDTDRLEARLLAAGFLFQWASALALLLAPSVQAGTWVWPGDYWLVIVPLAVWPSLAWILHRHLSRSLPARDPILFPAAMFLAGWGLQILVRLSPITGLRQTIWLALAAAGMVFLWELPHDLGWLRRYRYIWLAGALAALIATFFLGVGASASSPRLWLGLAGVFIQPGEFLRWIFLIFAAFTLGAEMDTGRLLRRRRAFPILVLGAITLGLLFLQQDLGAAMLMYAAIVIILFLAYRRWWVLIAGGSVLLIAAGAGFALDPIVHARILTWWNPWLDAANTSYQVVQSLIAVASGGIIGRGPGLGSPWLVPVAYSDFIFSAVGEEYGTAGALGCLLVISLLVLRGLRTAARSPDPAGRLLAGSFSAILGVQSLLIIAGELRLVPLTGVTLPWMSYGGSSLLSSAVMLAILLILSDRAGRFPAEPAADPPVRALAGFQIVAVLACAVSLGWWGIYRSPILRTRTDNYRRILHDLYAQRGNLFDRNGIALAESTGTPGHYIRTYPEPAAAPIVGYNSALYGEGGMEAALDPWLRGDISHDAFSVWWSETVLGVPAEGLSARLTIDSVVQDFGGRLLSERRGAIVVLDAQTGEIYALVSSPTYDPASLESDWDTLLASSGSPLLNRATQGLYPAGKVLAPFIAVKAIEAGWLPPTDDICGSDLSNFTATQPDLAAAVVNGFRFNEAPIMDLPTAHAATPPLPADAFRLLDDGAGSDPLLISPIQLALAYASLLADGMAPAPQLVRELETPDGWITGTAPDHPTAMTTDAGAVASILRSLASPLTGGDVEIPICGSAATAGSRVAWYAGSRTYGNTQMVAAVALEDGDPAAAQDIGRRMLNKTEEQLRLANRRAP